MIAVNVLVEEVTDVVKDVEVVYMVALEVMASVLALLADEAEELVDDEVWGVVEDTEAVVLGLGTVAEDETVEVDADAVIVLIMVVVPAVL